MTKKQAQKPTGRRTGWKLLKTRRPFRNKVFQVRRDKVELPGGKRKQIAYLERSAAVIIVPVTAAGEMVLIHHYRYAVDSWCLEVPAGGVKSARHETPRRAARRELREEVGGTCRTLTRVAEFYSANSLMDEKCHVFLAREVALRHPPERNAAEQMETRLMPAAEVLRLVRAGKMMDGQCALAILLCEPLLRAEEGSFPRR